MRKVFLIFTLFLAIYAFKEISEFEKRVAGNFGYMLQSLPQEKVYLHTDKSTYTVGENVWFRAYLVHAAVNLPMVQSRFVYVDLVDKRDSLVRRVKVMERDSLFYGQLPLSEGLQQGEYCLRAYTYNMQNLGDDFIFKKKIRVINPKDSRLWVDVTYERRGRNSYVAKIRLTDNNGEPYVHLPLTYLAGEWIGSFSEDLARTDRNGEFQVRIDTTIKTIAIRSGDYAEVSFSRDIHVPKLLDDFDVQFFPEGGHLIAGNWQTVAFKAIGQDGRAVEATGMVYQDAVPIAEIATEHDGMGAFRIPVTPGHEYYAMMRLGNGQEERFDLPAPVDDAWGLAVEATDSLVSYDVLKGANAVLPENLYVLLHSRGVVLAMQPVKGKVKGRIDAGMLPEGISHLVLMDDQYNIHSQRIFFHKFKQRPGLEIVTSRPSYAARELVEMEIGFEEAYAEFLEGSFSLTVTDDQKVVQDSVEDNILSNLLLTSDIRGHIDNPGYYFNDTSALVDRHLDLVMLTHGWTRFNPADVARGEYPEQRYEVEQGQVISGRVQNFWGSKSKGAEILVVSNRKHFRSVRADGTGHFVVDSIAFPEGTEFFVQASNRKGKGGVRVKLDDDNLLPPRYRLPNTLSEKAEEDAFLKRFSQDYYYEDGVRVYVLDEVKVEATKKKKAYSFYDNLARNTLDSAAIAEYPHDDWSQLIQRMPGMALERGDDGEEYFTRYGKRLYTLVNDIEQEMYIIKTIPIAAVRQISYLDPSAAMIFFGTGGGGSADEESGVPVDSRSYAANGALIITIDPAYRIPRPSRRSTSAFVPLGYQEPEAFYVPKYDVDSVRRDNRYDVRTTIYWEPVINLAPGERRKVSFYTADVYGTYSVILEGITKNGIVCRKRISWPIP